MTPFHRLGLAPGASAVEIKRAYARLLKQTRPEEDPEGFQALQEAYAHCLACTRQPAKVPQVFDHDAEPEHAMPVSFEPLVFEPEELLAQIESHLRADAPDALSQWLHAEPALLSLSHKDQLRLPVIDLVGRAEPLPSEASIEVLLRFFGLDQLGLRDEWLNVQLDDVLLDVAGRRAFHAALSPANLRQLKLFDRLVLQELFEPFQALRRIVLMLAFGMPARVLEALQRVRTLHPEEAMRHLNAASVHFWMRSTNAAHFAWPRLALVGARLLFWVPLASLAILLDERRAVNYATLTWSNLVTWGGVWLTIAVLRMLWLRTLAVVRNRS